MENKIIKCGKCQDKGMWTYKKPVRGKEQLMFAVCKCEAGLKQAQEMGAVRHRRH